MLAYDFGMTFCKIAYIDPTGKPIIVPNTRGEPVTPSALHYEDFANPLVGKDAIEQGFIDPENYVANFKLRLGSTENLLPNCRWRRP